MLDYIVAFTGADTFWNEIMHAVNKIQFKCRINNLSN